MIPFAETVATATDPTTTITLGTVCASLVAALTWALKTQYRQTRDLRASIDRNTKASKLTYRAFRSFTRAWKSRPCMAEKPAETNGRSRISIPIDPPPIASRH